MLRFDESGHLIKSVLVNGGKDVEELRLAIDGDKARWTFVNRHVRPPSLGAPGDGGFESQSSRYAVQRDKDGAIKIYRNPPLGEEIHDEWLAMAATDLLSRQDISNNCRIVLTNDLNFLAAFPNPTAKLTTGGEEREIAMFTIGNDSYHRRNHFAGDL